MKYISAMLGIGLILLAAMVQAQEPETSPAVADLIAELQQEGSTAGAVLNVPAQLIIYNNTPLWVFEYPDAEAAQADRDRIAGDASLIGDMEVEWAGTPHFFLRDNLIILYTGDQMMDITALEGLLGRPVAMGEMQLPSGEAVEDAEITDLTSFTDLLEVHGATVETAGSIDQPFLSVPGEILIVNGGDVQVFEYATPEEAQAEAAQIPPDGTSFDTVMVSWIDTPHFYQVGRLIVLYVGSDQATLDLLETLLDNQIAGG